MLNKYKQVLLYIFTKFVGSGFALSVFAIIVTIGSSFDLYKLSELLSSPWIWAVFYGYAIFCSIIVDGIIWLWPNMKRWTVHLYATSGFVLFIFIMFWSYWLSIIFVGIMAIILAMLFHYGIYVVAQKRSAAVIFAIVLPIHLIIVSVVDFTKKEDWEVIQESSSFQATFSYFNGEHKIPLYLKNGDKLTVQVNFDIVPHSENATSFSLGCYVENKKGDFLLTNEAIHNMSTLHVQNDGEYFIVFRTQKARGTITVDWDIQ